jgi:DNA-binding cell septation regulator SpoVG
MYRPEEAEGVAMATKSKDKKKAKAKGKEAVKHSPTLSCERIHLVEHKATRAFADLNIDGLVVKGYRVVEREDGSKFVSNPAQIGDDERWYSTAYTRDDALTKLINKCILKAFNTASK